MTKKVKEAKVEKAVTVKVKTVKRQAFDDLPKEKKPWLFSSTNRPATHGKGGPKRQSTTLLERFDKALKVGGGDKVVLEFMKTDKKKFFELYASMQPKNVSVKQEHTINFVELPPKAPLPALPDPEIIDVGAETEGVYGKS